MTEQLDGRLIVVSGASSGIGRACALEFARHGARLIVMGRNAERLQAVLAEAGETGVHDMLCMDLADPGSLEAGLKARLRGRKIDGVLACAGRRQVIPLRTATPDVYRDAFAVNTISALELVRVASSRANFSERGGSVVLVSSMVTRTGGAGLAAYAASKAALEGAMKAVALELAPRRIRVNCLLPGHIQDTGMWEEMSGGVPEFRKEMQGRYPLGIGTPADVAEAARFLLSDQSRWVTGTSLLVDGGFSLRS